MDRSIPKAAQIILLSIYKIETGKAPPDCYNVIFGNRQTALSKPITQMTLDEVEEAQRTWSSKAFAAKFKSTIASSAAGAAQFMKNTLDAPNTLRDIEGEMGLTGKEKFSPNLQDRMAYHLLKRRGFLEFMSGKLSLTKFGDRLAMEWASFPVLSASLKGAHRVVKRGQTYYAGDGVNKVLTKPEFVEDLLRSALVAGGEIAVEETEDDFDFPTDPSPAPITTPRAPSWLAGAVIAVIAALVGFVAWQWGIPVEPEETIRPFFSPGDGSVPIPLPRPLGLTGGVQQSFWLSLAMPILLSFVQPIIAAAAAWIVGQVGYWWFKLLRVNFDQASSDRLHAALERAIYAGMETLGSRASKGKLQAFAANYAEQFNPDDVKRFKLTTEDLERLAVPHIGKVKMGG